MADGSKRVTLVTSRTKVASLSKVSTPRIELIAAQIQSRLKVWLKDTLNIKINCVVHIVDASIILRMIKNNSLKFDNFTAPRITGIQTSTNTEVWYWLETSQNPSDLGTRGNVTVQDMNEKSVWRNGPSWLIQPFSTWQIKSSFKKENLPGLKKEFTVLNCTQIVELNKIVCSTSQSDVLSANAMVNAEDGGNISNNISNIIKDVSKNRDWHQLLHISAKIIIAKFLLLKEEFNSFT